MNDQSKPGQENPPSQAEPLDDPASRCMRAANSLELCVRGSAPGSLVWLPNGMRLRKALMAYSLLLHEKEGYFEVKSPCVVDSSLFEVSGHAEKYGSLILGAGKDGSGLSLRPMSCPNHILAYQAKVRSWRDLPIKLFEFGEVFRNEPSGSLQSFFRMRQFQQDDAHVFVSSDGVGEVVRGFLRMAKSAYKALGLSICRVGLSLRPPERFGDDAMWDMAEGALREACKAEGADFDELPGEGAFYGPKIEIGAKDSLGRVWQMGVAQLDFVLPERFGLSFAGKSGFERPAIIHHALLGSIERACGVLLESFGHDLPWWLHPVPAVFAPVSEKFADLAMIAAKMASKALPGSIPSPFDAPLGKKAAMAKSVGCPFFLAIGEREAAMSSNGRVFAFLDKKPVDVGEWLSSLKNPLLDAP